jgi:hypothetical protein
MYSSGEETSSTWTVENRKVFEEFRNVEIDVALHRKGILSSEDQQQGLIIAVIALCQCVYLRHVHRMICIQNCLKIFISSVFIEQRALSFLQFQGKCEGDARIATRSRVVSFAKFKTRSCLGVSIILMNP